WTAWQQARPQAAALAGDWSFSGHLPGKGELAGVMSVSAGEGDQFKLSVKGQYADGSPFNGEGSAILYNGYEWRGNVTVDGVVMRQ
ncbi:quinohemoprotein amine dehydrogenase subunit alpha, partial [Pseudomonas sp. SIMBA_077]